MLVIIWIAAIESFPWSFYKVKKIVSFQSLGHIQVFGGVVMQGYMVICEDKDIYIENQMWYK